MNSFFLYNMLCFAGGNLFFYLFFVKHCVAVVRRIARDRTTVVCEVCSQSGESTQLSCS